MLLLRLYLKPYQVSYTSNQYSITPELTVFAYINLKNKAPTSHISSAAFTNPVNLPGVKTSKVWYTIGTNLGIAKDRMEYIAKPL